MHVRFVQARLRRLYAIAVAVLVVLAASPAVAVLSPDGDAPIPKLYRLTDLGVLDPVRNRSYARDVNENGWVVGYSETREGNRGFLWTPQIGMNALGTLTDNDLFSVANAINDHGQIVGQIRTSQGGVTDRAVLWNLPTAPVALGALTTGSGASSHANDINNQGVVVGGSNAGLRERAFRWTAGSGMENLGQLGDGNTIDDGQAMAINDLGQIVGFTGVSQLGQHAFLWTAQSGMVDIDAFPADTSRHSFAQAINDQAVVAGDRMGQAGAFVWTFANGMEQIGDLPGANSLSLAFDISNRGHMVGRGQTTQGNHAFIWSRTEGMLDLNGMLDASGAGWTLGEAWGVNELGQIVGFGSNPFVSPDRSLARAFLLTPVPEPATAGTLLVGGTVCVAIGLRRRRLRVQSSAATPVRLAAGMARG